MLKYRRRPSHSPPTASSASTTSSPYCSTHSSVSHYPRPTCICYRCAFAIVVDMLVLTILCTESCHSALPDSRTCLDHNQLQKVLGREMVAPPRLHHLLIYRIKMLICYANLIPIWFTGICWFSFHHSHVLTGHDYSCVCELSKGRKTPQYIGRLTFS
jgi:hypothetical protein